MRAAPTRAQRREQIRADLVAAADRLFVSDGFHATSVDAIADEAGYTKGAVYSNFRSKDDLFLAVYEQRMTAGLQEAQALFADEPDPVTAATRMADSVGDRRSRDDGWLAVFFEFWAHALRNPETLERFATEHRRIAEAFAVILEQRGLPLPEEPLKFATAVNAMVVGLSLERLTQPDIVDAGLAGRMIRIALEGGLR